MTIQNQTPPVAPETPTAPHEQWTSLLTEREKEVGLMLSRGETNREIAKALGISIKTVDTHRGHVLKKLGCANNAKLVLFAVRAGVVTP